MSDILFENLGKFEYAADDSSQKELESEYLNHYIKSSTQINDKNAWKNRGFGASFRSDEANDDQAKKNIQAAVNGIALAEDGEFFYSITVNEMSGIFRKSISAAKDSETHVIHASDMEFYDVDYSRKSRLLAPSFNSDSFAQNSAMLNLQQGDYHILTDGDSMDRHPTFPSLVRIRFYSIPAALAGTVQATLSNTAPPRYTGSTPSPIKLKSLPHAKAFLSSARKTMSRAPILYRTSC